MIGQVRPALATAGTCLALLALFALTLDTGTWPLVWRDALAGAGPEATVLWQFRLPRAAAAVLAGACLGLSGAVLQTMLRNPLASPDVIGFTAGAGAGAVAVIALTGGTAFVMAGALGGSLVTALAVIGLSWHGGLDPFRLVLIGLALAVTMTSTTYFLLGLAGAAQAGDAARWLAGSFNARRWDALVPLGAVLALTVPSLLYLRFTLDRLDLGDDVARLLGLRVDAARVSLGLAAVALAAGAVSVSGPLPFVAFMAGPIARSLAGSRASCLLLSALTGALITLAADLAARIGIQGYHLPAGIYTAVVGGPFLLTLVVVQTKRNRL